MTSLPKLIVASLVAGVALIGSTVGASAANRAESGGGGASVSVTGSAVNGFPAPVGLGSVRLSVSARGGPGGPSGFVQADGTTGAPIMGAFAVAGPVTCLVVTGNEASIKYRFTSASGGAATLKGGGVEVFIQDNGKPKAGQPVDQNAFSAPMTAAAFAASGPSRCDPPSTGAYSRVRSGDYTITQGHVKQRHDGDQDHHDGGPADQGDHH